MAQTYVRVEMPRKEPMGMLYLAKQTLKEHLRLGDESPLTGFDMTTFGQNITLAETHLENGKEKHAAGEDEHQQALLVMGTLKGQTLKTKDTLYYTLGLIRSQLLPAYYDNEEQISKFGFNVVISGERVIIHIPRSKPDVFLNLCQRVLDRHIELGIGSPIKDIDMTKFNVNIGKAKMHLLEARKQHEDAESEMQLAYKIIGIYKKQTIRTKGTLYHELGKIRTHLLVVYQGNEERLSRFGFKVVVGQTGSSPDEETGIVFAVEDELSTQSEWGFRGKNGSKVNVHFGDKNKQSMVLNETDTNFIYHTYAEKGTYEGKVNGDVDDVYAFHSNNSQLKLILLPLIANKLQEIILQNNKLSADVVNQLLITLDNMNIHNCIINLLGNAAPTGAGITAKNNLIAKGCTVLTS